MRLGTGIERIASQGAKLVVHDSTGASTAADHVVCTASSTLAASMFAHTVPVLSQALAAIPTITFVPYAPQRAVSS